MVKILETKKTQRTYLFTSKDLLERLGVKGKVVYLEFPNAEEKFSDKAQIKIITSVELSDTYEE